MTEQVEQWICIKFALSLNIPPWKLFRWFRKPQLEIGSFIMTVHPLMHHVSCRIFLWNIKSLRWLTPATAQIWCPVTSSFYWFWEGRDFRPSMQFRKIQWGSWWRLGELCEAPRCLLWRGLRHHCPMYNVSCVFFNKCLFFILHGWIPSGQTSYVYIWIYIFLVDKWYPPYVEPLLYFKKLIVSNGLLFQAMILSGCIKS